MQIFDNQGATLDRFTLITDHNDVFGFSENPFHPLGFGQYCGTFLIGTGEHLGQEIEYLDLPESAKQFVNEHN